jgi:hypothetical protein
VSEKGRLVFLCAAALRLRTPRHPNFRLDAAASMFCLSHISEVFRLATSGSRERIEVIDVLVHQPIAQPPRTQPFLGVADDPEALGAVEVFHRRPGGLLLYPLFVTGIFEIPRIPYLLNVRAMPPLVALILVAVLPRILSTHREFSGVSAYR